MDQTYRIQIEALRADKTLTSEQVQAETLKLDMAKQRESMQARMMTMVQQELAMIEAAAKRTAAIQNTMAGLISGALSGGLTGSGVGSALGGLAGTLLGGVFGGPIGMAVMSGIGGKIGGWVGGLFGKKKKHDEPASSAKERKEEAAPVIKVLDAIERAQRDTITAIEQQTDALLSPENRLMNMPSTFSVPEYMPGSASGGSSSFSVGDSNLTVNLTISGAQHSPDDIGRIAVDAINREWSRSSIHSLDLSNVGRKGSSARVQAATVGNAGQLGNAQRQYGGGALRRSGG